MGTPTDRSVFVFRLVGGINKLGHLQFRLVGTPTDRKNTIDGVAVNNAAATLGNPSFVNSLGYDADIVTLDNTTKNYLTNSATNATIKLTTTGDQYWPFLLTTAIDVFEPNVVVTKDWFDDNGGLAELGDILTYRLKVYNKGTDAATKVELVDSLYGAIDFVPGSAKILSGPNTGPKTDALTDDQVDVKGTALKFRLGGGANGSTGGVLGVTAATDSVTTLEFKVKITNDCQIFRCKDSILNKAFVNFTGFTSNQDKSTLSSPTGLDAFGCPIQGITALRVVVPPCVPVADTTFGDCTPYNLNTLNAKRPGYTTYLNNAFMPITQINATGVYYAIKTFYPGCSDTIQINFTQTCTLSIVLVQLDAAVVNNVVQLHWKTASEVNNKQFEIERSVDGVNFEIIATQAGAINSNQMHSYNFSDFNYPNVSTIYYRIAQIDLNGAKKYTPVKIVLIATNKPLWIIIDKVIPNPVKTNAMVKIISAEKNTVTIKLFNTFGSLVYTTTSNINVGNNIFQLPMWALASGIYFINIIDPVTGKKTVGKVIKD